MAKKDKKSTSFSKALLVQESILIWIVTIALLLLAFYCVLTGFVSELPWITAMVALPWSAYGVSQAFYYKKSAQENTTGGIVYDLTLQNNTLIPEEETIIEDEYK